MVRLAFLRLSGHSPASYSSALIFDPAALHFPSLLPRVSSFPPGAVAEDVPVPESPLPAAHLDHQFPGPAHRNCKHEILSSLFQTF